jgi:hypothetical protein
MVDVKHGGGDNRDDNHNDDRDDGATSSIDPAGVMMLYRTSRIAATPSSAMHGRRNGRWAHECQ